jgi:mycothiol system anti-sigma-R factor
MIALEPLPQDIPPECLAVLQQMWDYLDDQLAEDITDAVRAHIARCPQCLEYQAFQESFLDALGNMRAQFGAPPLLRERILESLQVEGFAPR